MTGNRTKTKECPRCGRMFHPLGYPRHRAMHYDADQLLERYKTKPKKTE